MDFYNAKYLAGFSELGSVSILTWVFGSFSHLFFTQKFFMQMLVIKPFVHSCMNNHIYVIILIKKVIRLSMDFRFQMHDLVLFSVIS